MFFFILFLPFVFSYDAYLGGPKTQEAQILFFVLREKNSKRTYSEISGDVQERLTTGHILSQMHKVSDWKYSLVLNGKHDAVDVVNALIEMPEILFVENSKKRKIGKFVDISEVKRYQNLDRNVNPKTPKLKWPPKPNKETSWEKDYKMK